MSSRRMVLVAKGVGPIEVELDSRRDASLIGSHHAAIGKALSGDLTPLASLRGQTIRTSNRDYELETDLRRLTDLYYAGDLDYDDIYALE